MILCRFICQLSRGATHNSWCRSRETEDRFRTQIHTFETKNMLNNSVGCFSESDKILDVLFQRGKKIIAIVAMLTFFS